MISDNTRIGTGLLVLSFVFIALGVVLFFDSGLLTIGDLLFLTGMTFTIGFQRTYRFFAKRERMRGTLAFAGGILLVLIGWAFIGLCVQVFGFLNLFADFFPTVLSFARHTPVLSNILNLPGVSRMADKLAGVGLPR